MEMKSLSMLVQVLAMMMTVGAFAARVFVSADGTASTLPSLKPTEVIALPSLPYDYAALEPFIDENTVRIHHDKHHAKYVANTVELLKSTSFEGVEGTATTIAGVLRYAAKKGQQGLFNNAAQSYNHALYWECMSPPTDAAADARKPTDARLVALINQAFGSYDKFRAAFVDAGATVFGSGWVWLVLNEEGKLEILKTSNAGTPIVNDGITALLVMDVWEHAYYLKYQNLRPNYIEAFVDRLINWDFVAAQLPTASA